MESIPIKCSKCGKEATITAGEGHTGIFKCECGATTTIKGRPFDILAELQKMIPALIDQWKTDKQQGVATGLDAALHEESKKIALRLLATDRDLKSALEEFVEGSLRQAFRQPEDEGERR